MNDINHIVASKLADDWLVPALINCSDSHRQQMLRLADQEAQLIAAEIQFCMEHGLPIKEDA